MSMMSVPVVAMSVAVPHQLRGDSVAVGLVVDEDASEVFTGRRTQGTEEVAEVGLVAHQWLASLTIRTTTNIATVRSVKARA